MTPAYELGEEMKHEIIARSQRVINRIRSYNDERLLSEKVPGMYLHECFWIIFDWYL